MGTQDVDELLRTGREALAAADWERARSCFEPAGELGETADVLDGLGELPTLRVKYDRGDRVKERAFAAYRRGDRPVRAADTEVCLS